MNHFRNLTGAIRLNLVKMTEQEISELAAILVNEHGHAALDFAQRRKHQYAREPLSDAFLLWSQIAEVTARLLRAREARLHTGTAPSGS
jgi:hypothetical protein